MNARVGVVGWLMVLIVALGGQMSQEAHGGAIQNTLAESASQSAIPWLLTGNAGTNPTTDFIGTMDAKPLIVRVNNSRALRIEPGVTSPNILAGFAANGASAGLSGTTIAGGGGNTHPNRVLDDFGTIAGGVGNQVGDGAGTSMDHGFGTVGGGKINKATGEHATVSGGHVNVANGVHTTIGGGYHHTASGDSATIGGGFSNTASGSYATVPGGQFNMAAANYTFASGRRAKATITGAFVWADAMNMDFTSGAANQFSIRATGGVRLVTGITAEGNDLTGCTLPSGSGAWSCTSDRNAKVNIKAVDSHDILERLATVPVQTWSYKTQDVTIRHIGPTAQDFTRAFDVGEDNKHISTVDADGVALVAIQGLYQENEQLKRDVAALTAQVEAGTGVDSANISLSTLIVVVLGINILMMIALSTILLRRRST